MAPTHAPIAPSHTRFWAEWGRCWPLLAPSAREGMFNELDYINNVTAGNMMLWPGAAAAALTEPVRYPQAWFLRLHLAGGDLGELKSMERSAEALAKAWGFAGMEIFGRRGWLRALPGYSETCTLMVKKWTEAARPNT